MIVYRIEAVSSAPMLKEEEQFRRKAGCLERLNTILLDIFEENQSLWIQIAEIDATSTILAYAVYTPLGAEKGRIDVETDIQQIWACLPVQSSIALTLVEEISASDFNRAIQRHEMYDPRVREVCSKRFFRILQNMTMGIKSQTVWRPMTPQ